MRLLSPRSRKLKSIVHLSIGAFCLYLIYLIFNINNDLQEESEITTCQLTAETIDELKELAITLRDTLDSLNLKNFLCYYTLYGAIKNNQPIQWRDNLEFCILNEQLIKQDEAFIFRQFQNNQLALRYSTRDGFYQVKFKSAKNSHVHAKIFVFELDDYTKNYRRIGYRNRIIPPNECSLIHCFPERLIKSPLPLIQFISQDKFAVPHEREELLKYIFPDKWWKLDTDLPEKCR